MRTMKHSAYLFAVLATLAFYLNSCTKEADKIGLDIQPPSDELVLSSTDTITAVSYSVREDSVRTDRMATSLLGSVFDPVFGKTTASIFTQFGLTNVQLDFGQGAIIDSLILSIAISSIWGDSTTEQTFRVFEITESLNYDSAYYSNQLTAFNEAIELGSATLIPSTDSILVDSVKIAPRLRIPLNQVLAQKLLLGTSENFLSNINFRQFLKGLYITADPVDVNGAGAIATLILLTERTYLRAYYRNNENDSLRYTFVITNDAARYSHYEHYDYAHADMQFQQQVLNGDISLGKEIIYQQPLGGVKTYLRFPGLEAIGSKIKSGEMPMISVNEARIIFNNYESEHTLAPPTRLVLAKLTDNKGTTTILDDQREGENYFGGFHNSEAGNYKFRLNRYVQNRILHPDAEDFGLALLIPGASLVPQRVILKGSAADEGRIKLVIKYTEVR